MSEAFGQEAATVTTGASGVDREGVMGVFYERPVENKFKSKIEGRPIYESVPYVKIYTPNNPKSVPDVKVTDEHKKRWPDAWTQFERRESGIANGTPLEQWPRLTRTRVAELKAIKIYTVEQVAAIPDGNLNRIGMDARDIRDAAQAYLKGPDEIERHLREENEELKRFVKHLESRLDQAERAIGAYKESSYAKRQEDDEEGRQEEGEVKVRKKPGPKPKPKLEEKAN